jgi:hypothetical protein
MPTQTVSYQQRTFVVSAPQRSGIGRRGKSTHEIASGSGSSKRACNARSNVYLMP